MHCNRFLFFVQILNLNFKVNHNLVIIFNPRILARFTFLKEDSVSLQDTLHTLTLLQLFKLLTFILKLQKKNSNLILLLGHSRRRNRVTFSKSSKLTEILNLQF